MKYFCDSKRHLVCKPYSIDNLHVMADDLNIKHCWFHKDHYDIPKKRIEEIADKCTMVTTRKIVNIKNNNMELRMYFFVPYNLSPIQQAIQAGHAAVEYALNYKDDEEFIDFAKNWKTWIILNGGTTNSQRDFDGVSKGSLNQLADQLSLGDGIARSIKMSYFTEPDLEDALTAVCFIADERVFNYKDYPDLIDYILSIDFPDNTKQKFDSYSITGKTYEEISLIFPNVYKQWIKEVMGTEENRFIRELLKGKKLA